MSADSRPGSLQESRTWEWKLCSVDSRSTINSGFWVLLKEDQDSSGYFRMPQHVPWEISLRPCMTVVEVDGRRSMVASRGTQLAREIEDGASGSESRKLKVEDQVAVGNHSRRSKASSESTTGTGFTVVLEDQRQQGTRHMNSCLIRWRTRLALRPSLSSLLSDVMAQVARPAMASALLLLFIVSNTGKNTLTDVRLIRLAVILDPTGPLWSVPSKRFIIPFLLGCALECSLEHLYLQPFMALG